MLMVFVSSFILIKFTLFEKWSFELISFMPPSIFKFHSMIFCEFELLGINITLWYPSFKIPSILYSVL